MTDQTSSQAQAKVALPEPFQYISDGTANDDIPVYTADQLLEAIARDRAARAQAEPAPAGYVLVPREPTLALLPGQTDTDAAETYRRLISMASLDGCSVITHAWSCKSEAAGNGRCVQWCKVPHGCPADYEVTHRAAAQVKSKGWREVFAEARKGLDDATPSAFDNSGYRDYARIVLDSVEDELAALTQPPSEANRTRKGGDVDSEGASHG